MPKRGKKEKANFEIVCGEARKWLRKQGRGSLGNVVTGIPDLDETPYSLSKYVDFVKEVSELIFEAVSDQGYAIFMNTDRKINRHWVDKSYLIQSVAEEMGIELKWHKIVILRGVGRTDLHRPTYQHYLCFSYEGRPGAATPDVMECGKKEYKNASCPKATQHAIEFILANSPETEIVDPFVGRGTTLVEAKRLGGRGKLTGIGVDLSKEQCRLARRALEL